MTPASPAQATTALATALPIVPNWAAQLLDRALQVSASAACVSGINHIS